MKKFNFAFFFVVFAVHPAVCRFWSIQKFFTSNQFGMTLQSILEKLSAPSVATTFFFKEDDTNLDHNESAACYEAMLQHEFPMAPLYNSEYQPEINETAAIQKVILKNNMCKKVKAVFIPTTAYQLLHTLFFKKREHERLEIIAKDMKDFISYNQLPEIVDEFWAFNNFLLYFFKKNSIDYKEGLCQRDLELLISDVWDKHEKRIKLDFVPGTFSQKNVFIDKLSKDVLLRAIAAEYESNKEGTSFLLYRGNSRWKFPEFTEYSSEDLCLYQNGKINENLKKFEHVSMSYGASMFGGLYFDNGACAGYLMQGDDFSCRFDKYYLASQGYALLIDKQKLLLNSNSVESLFVVPPIMPLVALYSKGEFFHPRSKIVISGEINCVDVVDIKGFYKGSNTYTCVDNIPPFYYQYDKNHLELLRKLLLFIVYNAKPLTHDTQQELELLRTEKPSNAKNSHG